VIKKIVVPLDGSELAQRALPYASELAQALGAKLILLGVVPPPPGRGGGVFKAAANFMTDTLLPDTPNDLDKSLHPISKDSQMASLEAEVKRELMPIAEQLLEKGLDIEVVVAFGRPAGGIFHFTQHEQIDLIVMSTHGESGPRPYAYGGTADRVARRAPVPVLLVRPEEVRRLLPLPKIEDKPI
jgi:nucleotide-binding universal stress UspA family protein